MSSSSDDKKQPWYKKYKWYLVGGSVLLVCIVIGIAVYFKMKSSAPQTPQIPDTSDEAISAPEDSDLMDGTPAHAAPAAALNVP